MIKVLEVKTHGKYHNTNKLVGETIECPECDNTGLWITNFFRVKGDTDNSFLITCKRCQCEFLVEVE